TTPVCRNAPPTPFPQPVWAAESVVGGPRLAADGLVVDLPPGTPAPPRVPDVSYVLADMGTGEVLAAKAPHAWLRPASTLKTLTALTLIPRLDPRRVVVAKPEHEAANGTRVGILAGNRYPVGRLFDALLMSSANDAAYLLAEAAGGFEQTAILMNETARKLGAHDTVAVDPSGLDEEGQRSSAYDLALIGRAAMQLPDFRAYVTRRTAVFPGGKAASTGKVYRPFQIQNINDLLPNYPGAIGIKPGRTNRAQHTFIGAATRDGRTLIVTQMGSTTGDWKNTAALLNWGFAHADAVVPVGRLVEPGEAEPPSPAPTTSRTTTPAASAGSAGDVGPARPSRPADGTGGVAADGLVGEGTAATVATGGIAILVLGLVAVSATFLVRRRRHRPAATDSPQ
ncbi:hypothetical protein, partial [Intrasporangium sp.]|uniref:D-alanyl-D-alanine carboxypeptidase family protein n=1 Tax=Intrasporangium sp. TaxID=1925024 RepID=UPI00293AB379